MATASLASSEGWNIMNPSGIQRREKLTTLPTKGSSTITSRKSANTNTRGEYFSHTAIGICETASATTRPMVTAIRCRIRKCVGA